MREDGYCQIVGRIKEMVIRGGENIYPKEIEEALHMNPDIIEAHVNAFVKTNCKLSFVGLWCAR